MHPHALTGRYGRRYGIGTTINAATSSRQLRTSEVTLPRMLELSPHGYESVAVGKWHLAGYDSRDGTMHPLVMGFAHHDGHMGNLNEGHLPNNGGGERSYTHYEWSHDGELAWSESYATTETVDDAVRRIRGMREPWAAYVAFNAPHIPTHVPPRELTGLTEDPVTVPGMYRAMATAMDTEIGRLLDALDPGVRERTVVVFVGDNGTPDSATTAPFRPNHAKNTPYEGAVAVPLIVSGPGIEGGGREEDALVHALDIYATVAELAGVDLDEVVDASGAPVALDSQSLMPYLTAADAPHRRELLYTENFIPNGPPPYNTEWNIVRDERWKLIVGHREGGEFFDLGQDPHPEDGNENRNLLGDWNVDGLTEEQQAAYDRLLMELEGMLVSMPYEPAPVD